MLKNCYQLLGALQIYDKEKTTATSTTKFMALRSRGTWVRAVEKEKSRQFIIVYQFHFPFTSIVSVRLKIKQAQKSGDTSGVAPPLPIPNRAVKHTSVDDTRTKPSPGKVDHRQVPVPVFYFSSP